MKTRLDALQLSGSICRMKLFFSHASVDLTIAQAIVLRLNELQDVECSLSAYDIRAGQDWERHLREESRKCDAIACLVTRDYIQRPWFIAEWAAFWIQDKSWFLLMLDTKLEDVFSVMTRRQSAFLNDRHSVKGFLASLSSGVTAPKPLDIVAHEIVKAVAEAKRIQTIARAEANLARLAVLMQSGQDNVGKDLVEELLQAGQLDRMVALAKESTTSVKIRQLGDCLVQAGQAVAVSEFDHFISNHAESKNLGFGCLARLARNGSDESATALLRKIYRRVRDPQRRNLRDKAAEHGLDVEWPEVEPNP